MDIFLLLPSCGWCVNSFYFIFFFSILLFFSFSGFGFKISFSFSWVASLGIRVMLPLISISLGTLKDGPNGWIAYHLSCRQTVSNRKP